MADQWLDPARMRSASRWSQADLYDPEKKGMELLSESMNAIGRAKDWTPFVSFVVELERTDPSAAKALLAKVPAGLREHVVNPAVKTMRVKRSEARRALKREPKKTFSGRTKVSSLNIPSSAKPDLEAKAVADTKTTLLMSDLRKANEKEPGTLFPAWVQGGHIHAGSLANLVAVSTPVQREALTQWVESNVKGMEPKQDVDEADDVDSDDGEAKEPEKPKQLSTLQEVFSVVKDTIDALENEQVDRQSQTDVQSKQMKALRTFREKCIAEPGEYGIFYAENGLPSVTSISNGQVFLASHSGQRDKVRAYINDLSEDIKPAFKPIEEALDHADASVDVEGSVRARRLARQPELSPCYSALEAASDLSQVDRGALKSRLGGYAIRLHPEEEPTHLIIPAKFEEQVDSLRQLNDYLASAECKNDAHNSKIQQNLLAARLRLVEGVCAHLIADEQDLTHLDPLIDSPVVEEFYGRQRSLGRILMQPPSIDLDGLSRRAQDYIERMQKKQGEALFKELSGVLGDAGKAAFGVWTFSNGALYQNASDGKEWKREDRKAFVSWMEGSSQWGETNTYHAFPLEEVYRDILQGEASYDLNSLNVEELSPEQGGLLSRLRAPAARSDLCQADQKVIGGLNDLLGEKGAVLYGSSKQLSIYGGTAAQRQVVFDEVLKVLSEDTAKTLSRDFTSGLQGLLKALLPGLHKADPQGFFTAKTDGVPRLRKLYDTLEEALRIELLEEAFETYDRELWVPVAAEVERSLANGTSSERLMMSTEQLQGVYHAVYGEEWKDGEEKNGVWADLTDLPHGMDELFVFATTNNDFDLKEFEEHIEGEIGIQAAYSQEVELLRNIQVPGLLDDIEKFQKKLDEATAEGSHWEAMQGVLRAIDQELEPYTYAVRNLKPWYEAPARPNLCEIDVLLSFAKQIEQIREAVATYDIHLSEYLWDGNGGLNDPNGLFQEVLDLAARVGEVEEGARNQQLLAMNAGVNRPNLHNPQTLELQLPKKAAGAVLGFLKACQNAGLPVCWMPTSQTSGQLQIGDLSNAQRLELRNQLEALLSDHSEDLKLLAAEGKGVQVLVQKLWGPLLYQKCGNYDMPTNPQFGTAAWQENFVAGLENKELFLAGGNDELAGILKELHESCCISDGKLRGVLMGRCVPDAGGQGSYPEELSKVFNNPQVKGDYDPLRIRYFGPDEYKAPLLDQCRMLLEEANGVNNPSRISMLLLIMGALR